MAFIVYALPRSRTAWMAEFLTYKDWKCGHEQAIFMREISDIRRLFSMPNIGVVETAAAQAWRIIHHQVPNLKAVVIRRPVEDVIASMVNVDLNGYATYDIPRLRKVMAYGDRVLEEITEQPAVLSLNFSALDTEEGCRALFEHCLPYPFDPGWWDYMKQKNIQVDVPSVIRFYHENKPDIERFKHLCWRELRSMARQGLAKH